MISDQSHTTPTEVWHDNRIFFCLLIALFISGSIPLLLFEKISFFIFIQQWNYPLIDPLMPYLTWAGDGITYIGVLFVCALLGVSCRKLMIMFGGFSTMTIMVQLLKRVFFAEILRPSGCIPNTALKLIPGITLHKDFSFPSGHAATIFLLISVVQLISKYKKSIYSISLILFALLIAYSRIYLCQHFYNDIYIGALIGSSAAIGIYRFVININLPSWMDRSIYDAYDIWRSNSV